MDANSLHFCDNAALCSFPIGLRLFNISKKPSIKQMYVYNCFLSLEILAAATLRLKFNASGNAITKDTNNVLSKIDNVAKYFSQF